jgi:hypothetical protein
MQKRWETRVSNRRCCSASYYLGIQSLLLRRDSVAVQAQSHAHLRIFLPVFHLAIQSLLFSSSKQYQGTKGMVQHSQISIIASHLCYLWFDLP